MNGDLSDTATEVATRMKRGGPRELPVVIAQCVADFGAHEVRSALGWLKLDVQHQLTEQREEWEETDAASTDPCGYEDYQAWRSSARGFMRFLDRALALSKALVRECQPSPAAAEAKPPEKGRRDDYVVGAEVVFRGLRGEVVFVEGRAAWIMWDGQRFPSQYLGPWGFPEFQAVQA